GIEVYLAACSASRFSSSIRAKRARSIFKAMARFLCWLRSAWQQIMMPVGMCRNWMALDVLSAGAAGANGLLLEVFVADFDLDFVGDFGRDVDGREARLPLAFGVERA